MEIGTISHSKIGSIYYSLVWFEIDTDFLMDMGIDSGDTYVMSFKINYYNNDEEVHTSETKKIDVIVGQGAMASIELNEPDCYILFEDIINFEFW